MTSVNHGEKNSKKRTSEEPTIDGQRFQRGSIGFIGDLRRASGLRHGALARQRAQAAAVKSCAALHCDIKRRSRFREAIPGTP